MSMLMNALQLAKGGFDVFPCIPDTKAPYIKGGFKSATTDIGQIMQWWNQWPNAMIGLTTGKPNGIWALDVDMKKGANGYESLEQLQRQYGPLPLTWTQRTPSGGCHAIFIYPDNLKPGTKIISNAGVVGPGLDVRGDGGYIIVTPSTRPDGMSYQTIYGPEYLTYAPDWLLDLASKPAAVKNEAPQSTTNGGLPAKSINASEKRYIEKILHDELEKVKFSVEGQRNNTLYRSALTLYQLVADGYLDDVVIREVLSKTAVEREGGLPFDEVERTITSARQAGLANPRKLSLPDIPSGFDLREDGIYYMSSNGDKTIWHWIGGPLEILGYTCNADNESWGLQVRWKDPKGLAHTTTLQRSTMVIDDKSWLGRLVSGGWSCSPKSSDRAKLAEFFTRLEPKRYLRSVDRTGWQGEAFVLPDRILAGTSSGGDDPDICFASALPLPQMYSLQGALPGWQESIGRLSTGNSRLMLAICASLAGPLLNTVGMESGGFNLVGSSSIGKTTALLVGASVWGKGAVDSGFIRTWRSTSNALEGIASMHNDATLFLDELSQASGKVVGEATYMLANGMGKGRANRVGDPRQIKVWRSLFLSSGEIGVAEKIKEEGGRPLAGQEVRLIDIPADAGQGCGLFEDLHGFSKPHEFAEALRLAAMTNYGMVAPEFINRFIDMAKQAPDFGRNILHQSLEIARKQLCQRHGDVDGQVRRVAGRFALCLTAGALAIQTGVIPWADSVLYWAIDKCFQDWLTRRGTTGALEETKIISQVRYFIELNGNSRFQDLSEPHETTCHNRAGVKYLNKENGRLEYYVFPEVFKKDVCKGFDPNTACTVLRKAGLLIRKEGDRNTSKVPKIIPGDGYKRCYLLYLGELEASDVTLHDNARSEA